VRNPPVPSTQMGDRRNHDGPIKDSTRFGPLGVRDGRADLQGRGDADLSFPIAVPSSEWLTISSELAAARSAVCALYVNLDVARVDQAYRSTIFICCSFIRPPCTLNSDRALAISFMSSVVSTSLVDAMFS